MTGYTVHTGTSKKFTEGWDNIFEKKSEGKSTGKKKTGKKKADKSASNIAVKSDDGSQKKSRKTRKS
jgi:hypothetical protein